VSKRVQIIADDPKAGMTAAELRAALDGVPDDVRPRVRTRAAFHSDGGVIHKLTVEAP